MAEQNLTVRLESVKETELFHKMTVTPGLSADQIGGLSGKTPYTPSSLYLNERLFAHVTAEMAGWPYENVVSESSEETVFAIPDSLFDHIREDAPEVVAQRLAKTLHGIFEEE